MSEARIAKILSDINQDIRARHRYDTLISKWSSENSDWIFDMYMHIKNTCEDNGVCILDDGATYDLFCKLLAALSSVHL